jgi:hypothetical protein
VVAEVESEGGIVGIVVEDAGEGGEGLFLPMLSGLLCLCLLFRLPPVFGLLPLAVLEEVPGIIGDAGVDEGVVPFFPVSTVVLFSCFHFSYDGNGRIWVRLNCG